MFDFSFPETTLENNQESNIINTKLSVSVEKSALVKALSHVQNIVEKRNIIPILSNVRITCKSGILELTSTDMDILVSERISAHVIEEGAVTLPAHTFYDIVKKFADNSVVVIVISEKNKGKVDIISDNSNFSLPFLPAIDFPGIDKGIMPFQFSLTSTELCSIIDKSKFSVSTEETRYNLNGIYFHVIEEEGNKNLRAVATDGHRLSCISSTVPENAEKIPGVILPRKAVTELRRIIDSLEADILIELSNTKVKFTFKELEFICKLIDGNFPEYSGLIPKESTFSMIVEKKKFIEAIERVSTISFEKVRAIKFQINENQIELLVVNDELGEGQEITDCKSNMSEFDIGFNSRYLLDVLAAIEGDKVEFQFNDSFSPVKIVDVSDSSAVYVIMPMRI